MELYYKVSKDSKTGKAFLAIMDRVKIFRNKATDVCKKYGIREMYHIGWDLCGVYTCKFHSNPDRTDWKKVGYYVRHYPDKIESIDVYGWYNELPKEIYCNDDDFCFKIEWLDINLQEYFEELRKKRISGIKCTITHVEYSLGEHRKNLERISELKFEDLGI